MTNIRERLDRDVANDKWFELFPEAKISHLPHFHSNHCPLLVQLQTD